MNVQKIVFTALSDNEGVEIQPGTDWGWHG